MWSDKHSRRVFFVHSAHRTIGVSAALALWQGLSETRSPAWAAEDSTGRSPAARPLRVALIAARGEYRPEESLAAFQQVLEKRYEVHCVRVFSQSADSLPGLEALDDCDCAVFFTRRMRIAGEPLERIKRFCRQEGKAIIGIRTASHGFQNWLEMDREVFGGDYAGHYGNEATEVQLVESQKEHPVLLGVTPFTSKGSLYKNSKLAADTTVLLTGSIAAHTHPVAWVRPHKGGRVFYTSLGHPADFQEESFQRLLVNAIDWTTAGRLKSRSSNLAQ